MDSIVQNALGNLGAIGNGVDAVADGYNAYHAYENNDIDGAINDGVSCISHVGKAVEDGISGQWI